MTLNEAYREARRRLREAKIEDAAFDAACIFEKYSHVGRERLPLCGREKFEADETAFWGDVARREAREPLQYILGEWEFMGLRLKVGPGVLIPRPETELLAQTAVDRLKDAAHPRLLDLCAGSGCVTAAVLTELPRCSAVCVELSENALTYLRQNLALHDLTGRAAVVRADMLAGPAAVGTEPFDAAVCNPPYIRSGEIAGLQPEVSGHEPRLALDGGEDGLRFYRAFRSWLDVLAPGGLAAFEVGAGQSADVAALLRDMGLEDIFIADDYASIPRVVGGRAGGARQGE